MALSAKSHDDVSRDRMFSLTYAQRASTSADVVPNLDLQSELDRLGNQELEIHESQTRLLREQTVHASRDLGILRQEVLSLKLAISAGKTETAAGLDARAQELRQLLGQERREREAAQHALKEQMATVERLLTQRQQEDLSPLRAQANDLEEKLQKASNDLDNRIRQDHQNLEDRWDAKLQQLQQQAQKEWAKDRSSVNLQEVRLLQLKEQADQQEAHQKGTGAEIQQVQATLRKELQSQFTELQSVVAQHAEEAHSAYQRESSDREQQFAGLSCRLDELESDIRGRVLARLGAAEMELGKASGLLEGECLARQEQCRTLWDKTEQALSKQEGALRSEIEKLERSLESTGSRLDKALEATSSSLSRRIDSMEESQGSQFVEMRRTLEEVCRDEKHALQRLDSLEDRHGTSLDCQGKELSKLSGELQASTEQQVEGLQRVQQALSQAVSKQAEAVTACRDQAMTQLREAEARQAAATEQVASQLQEAAHNQTKSLRSVQAELAEVGEKRQKSFQEQLDQLRLFTQQFNVHEAESLVEVHHTVTTILDRVAACEEKGKSLHNVQKEVLSDIQAGKIGLDSCQAELKNRCDSLQKVSGESTEKLRTLEEATETNHSELQNLRSNADRENKALDYKLSGALVKISALEEMEKNLGSRADALNSSVMRHEATIEDIQGRMKSHLEAEIQDARRQASDDHRKHQETLKMHQEELKNIKDEQIQQAHELHDANGNIKSVSTRLEDRATFLSFLQKAHDELRSQHMSLDNQHADLKNAVEVMSGSHLSFVDQMKVAADAEEAKLAQLGSTIKEAEAQHKQSLLHVETTLQEAEQRIGHLETSLSEQEQRHQVAWSDATSANLSTRHAAERGCSLLQEEVAAAKAKQEADHEKEVQRLESLARDQDDLEERHAAAIERLASLERTQVEEAKLRNEAVAELRSLQATQAQQADANQRTNLMRVERIEAVANPAANLTEELQRLLEDERESRQADVEAIREQLSCEEEAREQHIAALQERCRGFERSMEHAKNENAHMAETQQRLNEKITGTEVRQASFSEKMGFVDSKLVLVDDVHEKIEELKKQIGGCEQHADWIGDVQRAQASLESDRTSLEADHAALKGRVADLDKRVSEASNENEKAVDFLRSETMRLSKDAKLRDSTQATCIERLEHLESSIVPAVESHSQEISDAGLKLERLQARLESCEKNGSSCSEEVRKLQADLGINVLALKTRQQDIQERLEVVEQEQVTSGQQQGQEMETARGRLDELESRMGACERLATGPLAEVQQALQAKWPAEKASMESHLSSLRGRLDELEPVVNEVSLTSTRDLDLARADLEQLRGRLSAAEQQQAHNQSEMRRLLDAELAGAQAALRERLADAIQQLPALGDRVEETGQLVEVLQMRQEDSRKALDCLQAAHAQLAGDLGDAASRSGQIATLLAQEQEARSSSEASGKKSLEQLESSMFKEMGKQSSELEMVKELAEELQQRLSDDFAQAGQQSSEVQHRVEELTNRFRPLEQQLEAQEAAVEEKLAAERKARELKEVTAEERLECECAARELQRRELSGLISRERQATERLTIIERSVTAVDELARREIEARARESRRLWDALDNHTHDLSTQVVELGADGEEDREYQPFPCQPLTGLLRLGNAKGVDFPLPKETVGSPPRRSSER